MLPQTIDRLSDVPETWRRLATPMDTGFSNTKKRSPLLRIDRASGVCSVLYKARFLGASADTGQDHETGHVLNRRKLCLRHTGRRWQRHHQAEEKSYEALPRDDGEPNDCVELLHAPLSPWRCAVRGLLLADLATRRRYRSANSEMPRRFNVGLCVNTRPIVLDLRCCWPRSLGQGLLDKTGRRDRRANGQAVSIASVVPPIAWRDERLTETQAALPCARRGAGLGEHPSAHGHDRGESFTGLADP